MYIDRKLQLHAIVQETIELFNSDKVKIYLSLTQI